MLGDITAPEPGSKKDSEASVSEEKSEALGSPNKGALCKRGHGNGHCHRRTATKLAQLSPKSTSDCIQLDHGPSQRPEQIIKRPEPGSGPLWGASQAARETVTPGPLGGRGAGSRQERSSPAQQRVGAIVTPALGLQLCPRLQLPPAHPPWRPALGEAERKSRLFWMPQAGSATVISFMCHCWL